MISVKRPSKDEYYIGIARAVSTRGTCQLRNYGAVIVSAEDRVVSTGYTGAPRGAVNCCDLPTQCKRSVNNAKQGEQYGYCRSVHAEANAIIHSSRYEMLRSTLYLVGIPGIRAILDKDPEPCDYCKRLIINAGIERVVVERLNGEIQSFNVSDWLSSDNDSICCNILQSDDISG